MILHLASNSSPADSDSDNSVHLLQIANLIDSSSGALSVASSIRLSVHGLVYCDCMWHFSVSLSLSVSLCQFFGDFLLFIFWEGCHDFCRLRHWTIEVLQSNKSDAGVPVICIVICITCKTKSVWLDRAYWGANPKKLNQTQSSLAGLAVKMVHVHRQYPKSERA